MRLPVPVRRFAFRSAYAGLRVYWLLVRPDVEGVKCVLTDGEDILLVRHTYGRRDWELPGGAVKRRESPAGAARREMNEELGLLIDDWRAIGEVELVMEHRHDRVHCFHAELSGPELTVDHGEIEVARWFPRDRLPRRLGRYTRRILDQVA